MLEMKNASFTIGNNLIIDNISLSIKNGEMVGLIGPNGAGKTTLLKMLAHITPVKHGHYLYNNNNINSYSRKQLAKCFGYMAQDAMAHWPLNVKSLIALGRIPYQGLTQRISEKDEEAIMHAANLTEVSHLLSRNIQELSGGERARVLLARLLASQTEVLFVDEPIASLDPYHQLHVMEILQEHVKSGGTVVIVLHDLNMATRFCDKLVLLDKGKIKAEGNINALLDNGLLENTYNIDLKMFCDENAYSLTAWQRKIR